MCEMPINGIDSLLLNGVCWDRDRFKKDYMGEFELLLEDIFADGKIEQPSKWFSLAGRRKSEKKNNSVSGEVQLQFTIYDASSPGSSSKEIMDKFWALVKIDVGGGAATKTLSGSSSLERTVSDPLVTGDEEDDEEEEDEDPSDETEDSSRPEVQARKQKRRKIRALRKRSRVYNFSGDSDVVGIVFLEISKVTDLPPEKNLTRTSFDMDPFVIASLGKKTYRTRVIRHNLNPVYNEKMIFQVLRHEQSYSISFTVVDRDKLSGNDFICSTSVPLGDITNTAPTADPATGLYDLRDPPDTTAMPLKHKNRFKIPMSRSSSSQSLNSMNRPGLSAKFSSQSTTRVPPPSPPIGSDQNLSPPSSAPAGLQPGDPAPPPNAVDQNDGFDERGDPDLHTFQIPLKLKDTSKWEDKHKPLLEIQAKYVPYPALRQQFWRAMLRQYDTDESGRISKIELTTMLDTLGSTLRESTIDGFFKRFPHLSNGDDSDFDLSMDEAVICLEDQLKMETQRKQHSQTIADRMKSHLPDASAMKSALQGKLGAPVPEPASSVTSSAYSSSTTTPGASQTDLLHIQQSATDVAAQSVESLGLAGEEGEYLGPDDLNDDAGEEHVVEIKECPICHQPRLNKRSDTDIITHVATCASQDWRQVNNIVMAGFVTSSQAQRKWYSKVITKISYGGYKLGANSANILVQDRLTGQINEERMSIYVRLGIRLLYKGLKSREMEKKRSMFMFYKILYRTIILTLK